mgnify:CR=1 FL=1
MIEEEPDELKKTPTYDKGATKKNQQQLSTPAAEEEEKQPVVQKADHNLLAEKEVGSKLFKLLDPHFRQRESLTVLDLTEKYIGDEGASAISKNTTWTNLTTLNLGYNSISAEGASAIRARWLRAYIST